MVDSTSVFDARWVGDHGIGRFAREVRPRLSGDWEALTGVHPVSARGLLELQRFGAQRVGARRTFFSPGFCAPIGWRGHVVLTVHDLMHLDVPGEAGDGVRTYYQRVVRPAVRRAPKTFTVSEHAKTRILEWSGVASERVVVIGNGVDAAYSPYGPRFDPGYPYVFYVGNHKPHKNVPRLLQAMADPTLVDLHLAMTGQPVEETMALARKLGILERVHPVGLIPEDRLPAYYRGATAVAMPSLCEGFGLPVLEAMACGIPAVAGKVSAVCELAGDAAVLVDPTDVDAMAHGLARAAFDTATRGQLAHAGPRRAAHFDWGITGALVDETLREINGA